MKRLKKKLTLIILAGAAFGLSTVSTMAATITADVVLNATSSDVSIPFQKAQLAQFDSSLGTLTGVTLTLSGNYSSTLTATNTSSWFPAGAAWTIRPYSMEIKNSSLSVSARDAVAEFIWLWGDETESVQAPVLGVDKTYAFSGSNLSVFTGPGFVDFYFGSASKDNFYGPWYVTTAVQSTFNGLIKASYSYTPAPLPSALIFLISGLLGMAGFKKFRKQTSLNG